eukprot:SAG22_NODE_119_length_19257_cov_43.260413_14_plen_137_part_00
MSALAAGMPAAAAVRLPGRVNGAIVARARVMTDDDAGCDWTGDWVPDDPKLAARDADYCTGAIECIPMSEITEERFEVRGDASSSSLRHPQTRLLWPILPRTSQPADDIVVPTPILIIIVVLLHRRTLPGRGCQPF